MAGQLERLQEHMAKLRLFKSRDRLEAVLQQATADELSYADFLDQLLGEEIASKTAKNVTMRTSLAKFPLVKDMESFDFTHQPSIDQKQVGTLARCHYIEHGENVVILGPPGVGKPALVLAWESRRSAIEPVIGHMKSDGKLGRNWLKGCAGDAIHAVLCGAGHNIRLLLRRLRRFYAWTMVV